MDKRSYGRIRPPEDIICRVSEEGEERPLMEAAIKDISPGGISFISEQKISQGSLLTLQVKFPFSSYEDPGMAFGKVVRCVEDEKSHKYEVGIAYVRKERP